MSVVNNFSFSQLKKILHLCVLVASLHLPLSYSNNLYTAYIQSQSNKLSVVETRQALEQVLIKVSGNPQINELLKNKKKSQRTINSYIISKNYSELLPQKNYWIIRFEQRKIDSLLHTVKDYIWGQPRPNFYIAILNRDSQLEWKLIDSDNRLESIDNALFSIAKERGIQFNYINAKDVNNNINLTDLQKIITDKYHAEYTVVLSSQEVIDTPLEKDSNALENNDDTATVHIEKYDEENPDNNQLLAQTSSNTDTSSPTSQPSTIQWKLADYQVYNANQLIQYHFTGIQDEVETLIHKTLNDIIDSIYLREIKLNTSESTYSLVLHNIDNMSAYEEIIERLQSSRWFKSLQVTGIENEQLLMDITLKGSGEEFFNYLAHYKPILRNIQTTQIEGEQELLIDDENTDLDLSTDEEFLKEGIKLLEALENDELNNATPPTQTTTLHFEYFIAPQLYQ